MNSKLFVRLFLGLAFIALNAAQAQLRVEISGVGTSQIPVAIATFEGADISATTSDIIRSDLQRSGAIKVLPSALASETKPPDFAALRAQGADAYAAGSVSRLANGQLDVRFRLWDVVKGAELAGQTFAINSVDARMAAHKIADLIHEKLTGVRGAAATRIAYVVKNGSRFALVVADSDGENAVNALLSNEPIISPAWSPSGAELAYVSFESRKPVVYVHTVATGARRVVANFKGINSAPAWFNDGANLVVTLSKDGLAQLYAIGRDGGVPRRLTQSGGIDTEPAVAPNGSIYFVSDRAGGPQIYRTGAGGGEASRVTFSGSYNISPAISPDGKTMAYVSRQSGFKLFVMPLEGGAGAAITDTAFDESPSFAPNGKLILYASRSGGREVLMTSSLDGQVKSKLSASAGDIREPAWGPYVK
jgi:TolB protein